jgi:hypothetical protein
MAKAKDMLSKAEEALSKLDKDRLPSMDLPQYHIVFTRPVKLLETEDGGMNVLKFDWKTGGFIYGMNLLSEIFFGHGDVEQVTEDEFIQYVEKLRARRIKPGEGTVYTLYELINAMEDKAKEEGRKLTDKEKAIIADLRRETYQLFEEMLKEAEQGQASVPSDGEATD